MYPLSEINDAGSMISRLDTGVVMKIGGYSLGLPPGAWASRMIDE